MRIAYVNGAYVPYHKATIRMEDRGYQFADGCYEVAVFYNQRFLDWDLHLKRLHYSLEQLAIPAPMTDRALKLVIEQLLRANPYKDGYIYLQVTRGVAKRNHFFPKDAEPSLTISVMPSKSIPATAYDEGVKVITTNDERWGRCDIKSIALLPNILALQKAADAGAVEAFMFNADNCLTECGKSTAFIVKDGGVHTHPESRAVLPGIRKHVIKQLCSEHNIPYHERMIPRAEVMGADEAFLTSATSDVLPVTHIDDTILGDGKAGAITRKLLTLYQQHVTQQTGKSWN